MQFEFDDEQLALQESVRRFLTERYDFETRRGCLAKPAGSSDEIWQAFAEQGFLSIGLPEAHGGIGGATELMLTMEEIGRALVLEPYLSTVALCAPLVADHGTEAQQADLLPRVAAGGLKLALAHGEAEARYASTVRTEARRAGDSYVLNGAKATVPDGAVADLLLVSAKAGQGLAVFLVDPNAPGVRLVRYRTQDGRSAADVFFKDVKLPAGQMLGDGDATAGARARRAARHRGVVRRGRRRHGGDERHDHRIHEVAQAIRPAHRPLPGSAAPHGRHVRTGYPGALDEHPGHGTMRHADKAMRPCVGATCPRPNATSARPRASWASRRSSCMAAWAWPTNSRSATISSA